MRKAHDTRKRDVMLRSWKMKSMRIVRRWRRGKRGTRRESMPLKRVTVCVGTSWEKAIRKDVCRGMVPLIELRLLVEMLVELKMVNSSQ